RRLRRRYPFRFLHYSGYYLYILIYFDRLSSVPPSLLNIFCLICDGDIPQWFFKNKLKLLSCSTPNSREISVIVSMYCLNRRILSCIVLSIMICFGVLPVIFSVILESCFGVIQSWSA